MWALVNKPEPEEIRLADLINKPEPEELYHHGIKGMKWGVRRYQNYDGTYTQKGLARYKEAESKYEEADSRYRTAKKLYKTDKSKKMEMDNAKTERKAAKKELNKKYDQLKRDKLADEGKEIYKHGDRIMENSARTRVASTVMSAALSTAGYLYLGGGKDALARAGYKKMADIAGYAALGTAAVSGLIAGASLAKSQYQDKRLRAYYSH